jgi:hexulose-6-phosphate isomerase
MPGAWSAAQCIQAAADNGFDTLELNLEESGDVRRGMTEHEANEIRKLANDTGVGLPSVSCGLGWKYPMSSPDDAVQKEGIAVVKQLLQTAAWLGADTVLVVPGMVTDSVAYDVAYERSQSALRQLIPVAEDLGVCIGIENVWNRFLLSPLEFARYVDELGSSSLGAYFDVGNVLVTGYPDQWIRILGTRIRKVHVKDFKTGIGNISGFCNVLNGDVPWARTLAALNTLGYDGPVTAEVEGYHAYPELGLRHIAQALDAVFKPTKP